MTPTDVSRVMNISTPPPRDSPAGPLEIRRFFACLEGSVAPSPTSNALAKFWRTAPKS